MQWSRYQDILNQPLTWLDSVEKVLQHECPITWTSSQGFRSKLFKYKATMQDFNSHKRIIEAVNEKAEALIDDTAPTNAEAVQHTFTDINNRYEKVSDICTNLL